MHYSPSRDTSPFRYPPSHSRLSPPPLGLGSQHNQNIPVPDQRIQLPQCLIEDLVIRRYFADPGQIREGSDYYRIREGRGVLRASGVDIVGGHDLSGLVGGSRRARLTISREEHERRKPVLKRCKWPESCGSAFDGIVIASRKSWTYKG